jgi:sulfate permease, SulP family
MGVLQLGALIRFIPNSVIIGFTNGIAILVALSQIRDFLGLAIADMPGEFFGIVKAIYAHRGLTHWPSVAMAIIALIMLKLWPTRTAKWMPGPFVVLIVATLFSYVSNVGIATIGSRFGDIVATIPAPEFPRFTLEQLGSLIAPAITIALLAAIESLLCAVVANKQTDDHADMNTELIAQGVANLVSPLFGGLAATSAVARTSTNVRNGARTPVAGVIHAAVVLLVLLIAAPLAVHVPLPALAAILLWVAFNMGDWRALGTADMRRYKPLRNVTLIATLVLTVLFSLTVAVEVGMVLAAFLLVKRLTEAATIVPVTDLASDADVPPLPLPPRVSALRLRGAMFFGVVDKLERALIVDAATSVVVIDMLEVIYLDSTALDAIRRFVHQQHTAHREVIFFGLGMQVESLFLRSGFEFEVGRDRIVRTRRQALELATLRAPLH